MPVRAKGGQSNQFAIFANHKKALVAETAIDSIGGKVVDRTRVYHMFRMEGRRVGASQGFATCRNTRTHNQSDEISAVHTRRDIPLRGPFIGAILTLKYQTRDKAPVHVLATALGRTQETEICAR